MSIEKERTRKFFESAHGMKLSAGFYVLLGLVTTVTFCTAKQIGECMLR